MRSIAYLLLANFRLKQKMEKSNVSFPSPKVPSIWREVPLFSSSKVIVTEKGISASGNWIFYSKTGGKFNCSVVHTNTGWVDGLIFGTFTCLFHKKKQNLFDTILSELRNVKSFTRSKSSKPNFTPRKARKLQQI